MVFGSSWNGIQTSGIGAELLEVELGPMMPITVYGSPLSEIVLPMTSGSLPKRRAQKPWLSTTTLSPSGQVFLGAEGAAAQDRRAEQPEEVGRHLPRAKLLGKRAAGEVHDAGVERRDVPKDLRLLALVLELGGRAAAVDALRRGH